MATPDQLYTTQQDIQRLLSENPIAAAELRAIVAERRAAELEAQLAAVNGAKSGEKVPAEGQ
tara:strand:+ start:513 stop:698 length:186 start_codon:yes stop_codon:yes gene_type:complete